MDTAVALSVTISGYRPVEQLYAGTKTLVYRAVRELDQQSVVIKLLRREYPTLHELVQFRNQYVVARHLHERSPQLSDGSGIVRPDSLVPYGNAYAFIMEDFGGISLRHYAQGKPLPLDELLSIGMQMADILHHLHQCHVIHKDIKPANILIQPDTKQIQLIDFSLATLLPKEIQEIKYPTGLEGTLAYLSPEQTGRMNRGIDYRSDLYSMGVTLFELLTGELPFQSNDPLELVHSHIAKAPPSMSEMAREVPSVIEQIIKKLMAKNAEDRYQSALGLKHDLTCCLDQLRATGQIESFPIAKRDRSDRFNISEVLYGREAEVQTILDAFERVTHQPAELMLIAGCSGVGKTAVVNEVHKPIVQRRGYFIKGKFDQFQRNIPLSAFVQSLRDLLGQLLTESDVQLAQWKAKILAALGDSAQVIVDVIPELEQIIGQQPAAPRLAGRESQGRFNQLFQRFVQLFATADHPLVIFLDDLQWADLASLELMARLMLQPGQGYLFLIGAYRDNEVSPTHPLLLMVDKLRKAAVPISTLTLSPLGQTHVNCLIADTLSCSGEVAAPLTELVYQKTRGNPFYTIQLLKSFHDDGLIGFEQDCQQWRSEILRLQSAVLTDDVVEFMAERLQKLPTACQESLKVAACIGNQFDLMTLAAACQLPAAAVAKTLWVALQEGLILPQNEIYKFFQVGDAESEGLEASGSTLSYKFLHDRIQQAAYSLIAADQKQVMHLRIGQRLWGQLSQAGQDDHLFEIVNHFNQGCALLTTPKERDDLARLNLAAGRKAKAATAYGAAIDYLTQGIGLLPPHAWQSHYELTLALHQEVAEAAFLNTDFEQMTQWATQVFEQAKTLLDTIPIYETQLNAVRAQGQFLEVVRLGLQVLKRLGIEFPEQPTPEDIEQAMVTTQALWEGRSPLSLLDLPAMTNPDRLAAMQILSKLVSSAYVAAPGLMPLLVFKQVEFSIVEGNCPLSIYAYADYGLILCGVVGDLRSGYYFGQLALGLVEQLQAKAFECRAGFIVYTFIQHWQDPLSALLPRFLEAYQSGLETGDLESVALNVQMYCAYGYFAGQELADLADEMAAYGQAIQKVKQEATLNYHKIAHQAVLNLLGESDAPEQLTGIVYNADALLPKHQAHNDRTALIHWHLHQLILYYLLGYQPQAAQCAAVAEQYLDAGIGQFLIPIYVFYDSLIQLALYESATEAERQQILERVEQQQQKMQGWATLAPANHQHRWELVEAERWAVLGDRIAAVEYYDRAIATAKACGYMQDEALANELAGKFYLKFGKARLAQDYFLEAYYGYLRWGAKAKVAQLEMHYPQLLITALSVQNTGAETISISTQVTHSSSSSPYDQSFHGQGLSSLDLMSVLKASQTLSQTINLDQLLAALLQAVIENAGADKCVLILQTDQYLSVEAVMQIGQAPQLLQAIALDLSQEVPIGLIYAVSRSLQPTILPDASAHPTFGTDPYILRQQSRSVLCTPILQHGKLLGILYLENHLTVGAFTSDRIELINVLCTQAAISLENARLYQRSQSYAHQLEQSLKELTISENRFQKLADNVPGMIYQLYSTPDGSASMPYVSSGCQALYEVAAEEMIAGTSNPRLMEHPDDVAGIEQAMVTAAQTLTPFVHEWRIITPSGELKWVQAAARPEQQTDGSILWDGLILDVSERKRVEAERNRIAEEQARLLAILETTSDLIGTTDPAGKTLYLNRAWRHLIGLDDTGVVQEVLISSCYPDWACKMIVNQALPEAMRSGVWMGETAVLDQKGGEIPVSQVVLAHKSSDGEVEYFSTIARDISDRKAAEIALKTSEKNLRTIFDSANNAIFIHDLDGRMIDVNDRMLEMYQVESREQALKLGALDYSAPDNSFDQASLLWERALTGEKVQFEWRAKRPSDGFEFDIEIVLNKITLAGKDVVIANIQDISERKRAENALRHSEAELRHKSEELEGTLEELKRMQLQLVQNEKMSALGNLVAGVAHEINNPVGFIAGNLEPAKEYIHDLFSLIDVYQKELVAPSARLQNKVEAIDLEYLREDLPKLLDSMKLGVERIRGISTSLRIFSRADKDYKVPFNVHDGIDSTLLILKHRLKANDYRSAIEVVKDYGEIPQVACFPGQLNQVFMNILANAIDALEEIHQQQSVEEMKARSSRITICTSLQDADHVKIQIQDNGIGMSDEVRQHIFDHLYTTKAVGKGTGLGLAIAHQIVVEHHNGTISVDSSPRQGTVFSILLPIKE